MRVEAESISSHGAAIVAFEASGLRTLSSRFERNGRYSTVTVFKGATLCHFVPLLCHFVPLCATFVPPSGVMATALPVAAAAAVASASGEAVVHATVTHVLGVAQVSVNAMRVCWREPAVSPTPGYHHASSPNC